MRTRNANKQKAATTTPPAKKSAAKTPQKPAELSPESSVTPKSRAVATRGSQAKNKETTADPISDANANQEQSVDGAKTSAATPSPETAINPGKKTVSIKRVTRVVKRKVLRKKTPTPAKTASSETPKSGDAGKEESSKEEVVEDALSEEPLKIEELIPVSVEESEKKEESPDKNVEESPKEDDKVANADELAMVEEVAGDPDPLVEDAGISSKQESPVVVNVTTPINKEDSIITEDVQSLKSQEPSTEKQEEEANEVMERKEIVGDRMEITGETVNIKKITTEELKEDTEPLKQVDMDDEDEKMEEQGGQEVPEELRDEEIAEENVANHHEETQRLEEECAELTALAEERKIKKELEIFVGGLDRDAEEADVKKVFQHIGDVVEVRVQKDPSNNKNKGYAFVKFATKEQATRALAEMRNPVIKGKRCGTAPCEDNDTLFVGNICNTWTKEAIRQKLKTYGIDGVESITLVSDPKHEGLSRGFAFIEFSCHGDAMIAYKRLQKPDVVFGHLERSVKVAFAEPLREPDPEVMKQVKSVFVDGLPSHWDEDHVRKVFKSYGDIERIMLARNMSTSKRKDFGFVDFTTHEAAVACIDDVNSRELSDGKSKARVRARLSNPLPKTQAVKGEMCGGFKIGRSSSGALHHSGRDFGRGGHSFNRTNFQHGRDFYHHGPGQASRMGFPNDYDFDDQFRGRQSFGQGGRWGSFRGAHRASGRGAMPGRSDLDRPRHGAMDSSHDRHRNLRGQPFAPEEFNRPFLQRHYDDPYLYNDHAHGIKRPFFTDQDPNYMEPSRVRPRVDYSERAVPIHGSHHRDTFGAGSSLPSHDYYGSDYRGGMQPSLYRGDHPYGGGYY